MWRLSDFSTIEISSLTPNPCIEVIIPKSDWSMCQSVRVPSQELEMEIYHQLTTVFFTVMTTICYLATQFFLWYGESESR